MKNNIFTNNFFKVLAVISMIIDHFGFYFYPYISDATYLFCRIVGRFAMPVFLYFIVYGYFKTKDFNKYLIRVFLLALITQICILMLTFLNFKFVPTYVTNVYYDLNILFSFVILLITMKLIDSFNNNKVFSVIGIVINFILLCIFNFDYDFIAILIGLVYYFAFKFKVNKILYISFIVFYIIIFSTCLSPLYIFMIVPVLLLTLHNGKIGRYNLKDIFYYIFPLQHILLYGLALICTFLN